MENRAKRSKRCFYKIASFHTNQVLEAFADETIKRIIAKETNAMLIIIESSANYFRTIIAMTILDNLLSKRKILFNPLSYPERMKKQYSNHFLPK